MHTALLETVRVSVAPLDVANGGQVSPPDVTSGGGGGGYLRGEVFYLSHNACDISTPPMMRHTPVKTLSSRKFVGGR